MSKPHIDTDNHRLRPHLRGDWSDSNDLERQQATAFAHAFQAARNEGKKPTAPATHQQGEPAELRGIPALTRGVGGVIRGTQPEQETIARSERRAA